MTPTLRLPVRYLPRIRSPIRGAPDAHIGPRTFSLGDRIWAAPISSLWA